MWLWWNRMEGGGQDLGGFAADAISFGERDIQRAELLDFS